MKPTVTRIERLLEKLEALPQPPRQYAGCLRVIIHELCEGESREEAFAEIAARHPQNVAGKTVDDLNWSDDEAGAMERALAEHIAAHPEHAGLTVKDFRWSVINLVSSNPICAQCGTRGDEDNKGYVFRRAFGSDEIPLHSGCEELWRRAHGIGAEPLSAEGSDEYLESLRADCADPSPANPRTMPGVGAPTGNGRPELCAPAPVSNGRGLDGGPDRHRSGAVLSFAEGLKERSRRLGRPLQNPGNPRGREKSWLST